MRNHQLKRRPFTSEQIVANVHIIYTCSPIHIFKHCAISEKESQYSSLALPSSVFKWYKNIAALQGLSFYFIGLWISKLVAINSGKQSHQDHFYRVKWLCGTRCQGLSKIWRLLCCTHVFIKALKPVFRRMFSCFFTICPLRESSSFNVTI